MLETTPLLTGLSPARPSELAKLPLYSTIWSVFREIANTVDVPLSEEQLRSPEIQFAMVQPLEVLLAEMNDPSIVYVLLLCRLQFLRERDSVLASSSLSETRAQLCEVLAMKLLRHQATQAQGSNAGLLAMANALVGGFHAFQGAGPEVLERVKAKEGYASRIMREGAGKTNALELAILGKARGFIKSQGTQRVINAIWEGRVVYTSSSFLEILPDRWKTHQIRLYNIKDAPLLDHYRLRVPKYRAIIDFWSFVILFVSFLAVIADRHNRHEAMPVSRLTIHEKWFFVYALGYGLDKIASIMGHGWSVFSAGLTNGLDALCLPIFAVAFGFRIHSVITNEAWASDQAFAVLSVAACLMFPRLAFAVVSRNLLILSLRAMLADFFWLMGIAVFCFLGFVFALQHMCDGEYSVSRISEWLIFIWFGLDGTGIDKSVRFHPTLGPALMISYAALSNTLLVSLLVAILSGTYASIAADAAAETMFRKAVLTFEGVKSDSLFDYIPPLNLIAFCVMLPISKVSSPRWFHKINVATTRMLSFPILLLIALYERQIAAGAPLRRWWEESRAEMTARLPFSMAKKLSLLEGAHWECEAVFEYSPSGDESSDDGDFPSSDDEVEDIIESGSSRLFAGAARASRLINPATAPLLPSRKPSESSLQPSSSSVRSPSPAPPTPTRQPKMPAPPMSPQHSKSQPRPMTTKPSRSPHAHFSNSTVERHERLPSNASNRNYAFPSSLGRTHSSDHLDTALSTSPSLHFTSPLSELYGKRETEGLRRRLSLGPAARADIVQRLPAQASRQNSQQQGDQQELRDMVASLADALARVEAKLDKQG